MNLFKVRFPLFFNSILNIFFKTPGAKLDPSIVHLLNGDRTVMPTTTIPISPSANTSSSSMARLRT